MLIFNIIVLGFIAITLLYGQSYQIHIHHYTVGMLFVVLLGYQSLVVTILHGFVNGVMIEGASRWGYDPVWKPL